MASMLRVTGDNEKLRKLIAGLKTLSGRASRTEINVRVGKVVAAGIDDCFKSAKTPYGERWKPLRYRRTPPPILQVTRKLRRSIRIRSTHMGNHVESPLVYANTQNYGRDAIPARAFVPSRGIPSAWQAKMVRVIGARMRKAVGK